MPKKSKIEKERAKEKQAQIKSQKIDKDTLMNTPKETKDGVKVMPYDEETLTVFSLKKMNFKDMTGYQKNTLIILIIFILCFIVVSSSDTIRSMFTGVTSGSLRLPWQSKDEDTDEEKENIVAMDNFIKIGSTDAIKAGTLKFSKFQKSDNEIIIYNYTSTEDIDDVKKLNYFIEIYNNTKTLITRQRFLNDDNTIKASETNINKIELSSNNYNKAYYIKIKYLTDAEIEALPDYQNPDDEPSSSGSGNGSGGNGSGNGDGGNVTNPDDPETVEEQTLSCYYTSSDKDLKITKNLTATFVKGKVTTYSVEHSIISMSDVVASNYTKYYKKLLKEFKNILQSPGCEGYLENRAYDAKLTYTVTLKKYKDVVLQEGKDYDMEALKDQLTPYRLEIEKGSTIEEAIEKLEATNEWICD